MNIKKLKISANKWKALIGKMPCGRSYFVPFYGRVRAYRSKKTGRRVFALSTTLVYPASGELSLKTICNDIGWSLLAGK